jgi:hypothetical protein
MADDIGVTHLVAHVLSFFGYVAAMVVVPRTLSSLIDVRAVTTISGSGFFITCGLTHLGLALEKPGAWWVSVNDHLQAGFILVFVASLMLDLIRAQARLTAAFAAIGVKYGRGCAEEVQATIEHALAAKHEARRTEPLVAPED